MNTTGERWAPQYQPSRTIAPFYSLARSAWIPYVLICDAAGTLTRIEGPTGSRATARRCRRAGSWNDQNDRLTCDWKSH